MNTSQQGSTMFRTAPVVAFLALAGCGGPPVAQPPKGPYRLSDGSTTMDLAVWNRDNAEATARVNAKQPPKPDRANTSPAALRTVAVPARTMAAYQAAVADTLRDPESARFRGVRVVREADGGNALCGELNARNAYGGYVGYEAFYAPLVTVGDKAAAVLWTASRQSLETILEKCGLG